MNNTLFEIPLKNGFFLIGEKLEINDGGSTELYISVIDENHNVVQDIAMFRDSDEDMKNNVMSIFLWTEKFNENCTSMLEIPLLTKKEWEEIET